MHGSQCTKLILTPKRLNTPQPPNRTKIQAVRGRAGVTLPDALDSLLLRLLCDCGEAAAVEALVLGPHAADPEDAEAALRGAGRWHALALLHSARGEADAALTVWQVRTGVAVLACCVFCAGLLCPLGEAAQEGLQLNIGSYIGINTFGNIHCVLGPALCERRTSARAHCQRRCAPAAPQLPMRVVPPPPRWHAPCSC